VSPLPVVSIGVEVKNLKALIAACSCLDWNVTIGHEHFRWFGSWVDDSPVPRQLFAMPTGQTRSSEWSRSRSV
jgi:hypothetical protein